MSIMDIFPCFRRKKFPVAPASASAWTIGYSPGMPTSMKREADGTFSFVFPPQDGIHYVYKIAPALKQGQKVSMAFRIDGNGTIVPTEGPPPARVRLFIQEKGDTMTAADEFKRWWSTTSIELKAGAFILSAEIVPGQWSQVFGKLGADFPDKFKASISNAGAIGFTFGGMFAGHGDFVKDGTAKFVLDSYSVV